MCELFGLSSRLPTITTFSLRRFADRGGGKGPIDGWGLALHDGRGVRLYKEPEPAADSLWLAFIQARQLASALVLSHIRRATQGAVQLVNTQPFGRELGGRMHVFAHNGRLDGIEHAHANEWHRFKPLGDTDSEVAFCILLERLAPLWSTGVMPSIDDRFAVIAAFAAGIRALGPANFLYIDGDALFAHGDRRIQANGTVAAPGLWRLARRCRDGGAFTAAGVTLKASDNDQEVGLIASVPLNDEPWMPFGEGELVAISGGRLVGASAQRAVRYAARATS